ncbi:MAG TPA: FAD-binding oxidoreductase [Candidatus Dormibacteraeota bacterium]|nr:FAD-binding oxidoreductase [Candidatus Dormibacteraeota bacterium]
MDVAALAQLVPRATVVTEGAELRAYAGDWSSLSILRGQRGAETPPAAVLRPSTANDVAAALRWASDTGTAVVAGGGRSGVSGGVVTHGGELVLDLRTLNHVVVLDEVSGIVEVEAGVLGTELEEWLNQRGFTLGHFPQSVALSTVGGWIAARSAGQLSSGYGAVEDFLVALTAALPDGSIVSSRVVPRTAAGIQLHQLFLGSEGTLGVVTSAWLRVRRAATARRFASLRFDSFADGLEGVRRMSQHRGLPDAVRVYDETDTTIQFRGFDPVPTGTAAVLVAEDEDESEAQRRLGRAVELCGGVPLDHDLAGHWWQHRNDAATTYQQVLSGELLGGDVAADTIEVAAIWARVPAVYAAVRAALSRHAEMVGCHCSHAYETGCALYFTFLLRAGDREAALQQAWHDALDAALESGGTMTHHHGVGQLKTAWLGREMGGFAPYLGRIQRAFDPAGVMNPRTLRAT